MPTSSSYVVMLGNGPLAAASSLEAAKADAFARETRSREEDEYHWTEPRPGEWRLMGRSGERKRFSWTQFWVVTVATVEAGDVS